MTRIGNPGATAFGIGALTIEFGVMLALAYVLTRSIWLPAGIHMAWNFTQGYVFGGSFGPEASILALVVSAVASVILIVLIVRKRGWQPVRLRLRLRTGLTQGSTVSNL